MRTRLTLALVAAACTLAASPARAGPYSDELAKCLVQSTTPEDRGALVRWMFIALANHPAVRSVASVSSAQTEEANKTIADLFVRLLTTSCREGARRAIQYEGAESLPASFGVLGNVAGRELMSSPEVAASLAGLQKHVDAERLQELVKGAASPGR